MLFLRRASIHAPQDGASKVSSTSEQLRGCTPFVREGPSQVSVKETEAYVIIKFVGDLPQFCVLEMLFVGYMCLLQMGNLCFYLSDANKNYLLNCFISNTLMPLGIIKQKYSYIDVNCRILCPLTHSVNTFGALIFMMGLTLS